MYRAVRRIRLLAVLALLLSGLFQSLATAQGVTCAGTHASVDGAEEASDWNSADSGRATSVEHAHDPAPQPGESGVPAPPCGVAAIASERSHSSPVTTARQLLPTGDLPPGSLFIQPLFRPPRLS